MSDATPLSLPPDLPFPIRITSIDAPSSSQVQRGTRLLSYSFVYLAPSTNIPESRFGTWDSELEGSVHKWNMSAGDVISQRKAADRPAVLILEPCTHNIQIGGLCAICGKDMTITDYTGFSDASRASIQMTHSAFGPTVSLEEAQRIERETADHLLKSRKLSLIVDLDQTIVHATVDPTVGEWIAEGEAWEARHANRESTNKETNGGDDSDSDTEDSDDECNPNWEALKDVKKFRLGPETFGPGSSKDKGKHKSIQSDGCMYYIKPRPGWSEFLADIATKYEMHVYTMGTRAYAQEVCAAIDPDGKVFAGRILSRDESGSLTQKSLQRLFPCDTSMVVIIDDRADVWEWSPNLVKVIPFEFFIGIGDINSSFLPKIQPLDPTKASSTPSDVPGEASGSVLPSSLPTPSQAEREETERATNAMRAQNSIALEAQVEERILAKKQEEIEKEEGEEESKPPERMSPDAFVDGNVDVSVEEPKHHRKALLKNDDVELDRVTRLLNEVHSQFFSAYDTRPKDIKPPSNSKRRHSVSAQKRPATRGNYDVTRIIPALRADVLRGTHILFSGVIPLDVPPHTAEIYKMARMFGATVANELNSQVTHVVAAKKGTVKVDMARRMGGIKIVYPAWLTDSIAYWRRQDETPYFLDDPPTSPVAGPSKSPTIPIKPFSLSLPVPPEMAEEGEHIWELEEGESDLGAHGGGGTDAGNLQLGDVDWNDANAELEAFMNESDDDDEAGSEGMDKYDDDGYDDDGNSVDSRTASPKPSRKRVRSRTPSDVGTNGVSEVDGSPSAKRKRLSVGESKLKESVSLDEVASPSRSVAGSQRSGDGDEEGEEDGDEDDEDEDEEPEEMEDFLTSALEEEELG